MTTIEWDHGINDLASPNFDPYPRDLLQQYIGHSYVRISNIHHGVKVTPVVALTGVIGPHPGWFPTVVGNHLPVVVG
jgi:hypothetical protein